MPSLGRLFSSLHSKTDRPRTDIDFFTRPESFSLIVFTGDVTGAVPAWFAELNYRELERRAVDGDFRTVYDSIRRIEGANDVVLKATYLVPGFTVVLDPEMVLAVESSLPTFCTANSTRAVAVVWERYSETTLARATLPTGDDNFVHWLKGKCVERRGDWPQLAEPPGPEWLTALLRTVGVSTELIFGRVSTNVFRLQE